MTYSIVARDPDSGLLGVGIQSHFFAAGAVAVFCEPGVGAISTQAFASRQYGPLGLQMLAAGMPAEAVLDALLRLDPHSGLRQLGIVDAQGRAAAFTGGSCVRYAAHLSAPGVAVQGNMLAAPGIPDAMLAAYQAAKGDFAARILAALDAAEAAGGDARGRQSASLTIVGPQRDGRPWNAVVHDERVDDHPAPLIELRRLVGLRRGYHIVGAVLFEHGPLFSEIATTAAADVDAAIAGLRRGAALLGDDNYEAEIWQLVLLARHGRAPEAQPRVGALLVREPKLAIFIDGLAHAGIITPAAAATLLAQAP